LAKLKKTALLICANSAALLLKQRCSFAKTERRFCENRNDLLQKLSSAFGANNLQN
jgi:hypothetical protein